MLSHYHCTNAHTFLNTFGQVGVMVKVGFLTSVGKYAQFIHSSKMFDHHSQNLSKHYLYYSENEYFCSSLNETLEVNIFLMEQNLLLYYLLSISFIE